MSDQEQELRIDHEMHEAGHIAFFSIYTADGDKIQYTIRVPHGERDFGGQLAQAIRNLQLNNFHLTAPGMKPGEQCENVTGWVYGKKKDGHPCVWIYPDAPLKFALSTIYEEDFDSLPFPIGDAKQWPTSQCPERDEVVDSEHWNAFDCKVAMVDHPRGRKKKDSDEVMQVIGRWIGYEPAEPEAAAEDGGAEDLDVKKLPLNEVVDFETAKGNFFAFMDVPPYQGKARSMAGLFVEWVKHAQSIDDCQYIKDAIAEAIDKGHMRERSKRPIWDRCDARGRELQQDDIPI